MERAGRCWLYPSLQLNSDLKLIFAKTICKFLTLAEPSQNAKRREHLTSLWLILMLECSMLLCSWLWKWLSILHEPKIDLFIQLIDFCYIPKKFPRFFCFCCSSLMVIKQWQEKLTKSFSCFTFNWINYGASMNIFPLLIFTMTFWFAIKLIAYIVKL